MAPKKRGRHPIPIKGRRRAARIPKPPVTYSIADEVRRIATKLIAFAGKPNTLPGIRNVPEGGLPGMTRLRQARILFLFSSSEKVGRDKLAQASKFAKKHLPIADEAFDFEILTSKPLWGALTEEQRYALTFHELLHCGTNDKDNWVLVPHDLEEFAAVVRHFGLWNERTKIMAEQMRLFDRVSSVSLAASKS